MSRTRSLVLALLVITTLLAPAVGAGTVAAAQTTPETAGALSAPTAAAQETANNTTSTPAPADTAEKPKASETVRVLPVQLDVDFVSVNTHKQGRVYNTSGPFAFFSLSEPVDQASISQQGAEATVLEGGHQVRVQYDSNAAPVGESSLYTLTLWFDDGSSRTIDLFARQTSVSTGSAEMKKYRPFILRVMQDAERNGYDRSPDGVESHYEDVRSQAQLLDSFLSEQAKRLFGSLFGIVVNPLGIASLLILASLVALYQLRQNATVLELLSTSTGKAEQLRERLWIEYEKQQQTAADEQLRDVRGIGEMGEIYWSDTFGVDTTAGLAELFRKGIPVKRDGEVRHVGGVENLDADEIERSWLEAVCRDNRLASPEIALSHGKSALRRMISEYGMAHHYSDTYGRTSEIIDELDQSRDVSRHSASSSSPFSAGSGTGGDD